jgi:diguanylate cyclase (GGDEF)-like protein
MAEDELLIAGEVRREVANSRLRALTAISRAATAGPADEGLTRILEAARNALGGASASMGIWDPEQAHLRTVLNIGELGPNEEREPADEIYTADQSTWLATMSDGHLGMVLSLDDADLAADDRVYLDWLDKHSSMSLPILQQGQWWGELFVARRADQPPYADNDLEWGVAVAAQMGAALESTDHLARIERLAHTDPLTGLANRLAVDETMDEAVAAWRDRGEPLALVVCDLNGLKTINDRDGHDAGDRALVAFARLLDGVGQRLPGSLAARLGGDEFCLVVRAVAADRVVEAAESLCRRAWDELPDGVSCGVVCTTDEVGPIEAPSRLFRLADAAQYRAKRTHSPRPIVAGRTLPAEAAVALDHRDAGTTDRRLVRGRRPGDQGHLLAAGLRALDQVPDEPARARLAMVAEMVAHHLDALGWWLSLNPAGSDVLRTVDFSVYRATAGLTADEVHGELGAEFLLDAYPATRVALSGQAFVVHTDQPSSDPAELAILDGLAATGVVCSGGVDVDADRWLVEVYTDLLSGPVQDMAPVLRVLMLAALHPFAAEPADSADSTKRAP